MFDRWVPILEIGRLDLILVTLLSRRRPAIHATQFRYTIIMRAISPALPGHCYFTFVAHYTVPDAVSRSYGLLHFTLIEYVIRCRGPMLH